ncbi:MULTISPECIES: Zn-dependent alcohol dehydrogenase [unclassified Embleya]|uniref:Zn-dependent alcohol dehydrogenase n=1 Tax=unclassified Embleya TaxID=2699296 RepID=UPI0036A7E631
MRAAILTTQPGTLDIVDIEIDLPGPGEVLVRTAACGLCHSDIHILDGAIPHQRPAVLGHEASGTVVAVGPGVTRVAPGDHVVACLSVFCGRCPQCARGRTWLCSDKAATMRDADGPPRLSRNGQPVNASSWIGGLAEQMLLHQNAVVAIDPAMPLDVAAVIGCAVTTGVGAAWRSADIRAGETVAVLGCGGIGLNIVQGARLRGAGRVIAIDLQPAKRELARALGATDTIDAASHDAVAEVLALTAGFGVDHAFEAIGLEATIGQAVAMTSPGGTAYVVGVTPMTATVNVPGYALWGQGKTVRGVHMGSNTFTTDMPRYVDLYLQGRLRIDELISRRIPLTEVNDAYDALRRGEVARSVVTF